jgi:UDP:flavonoid glycosyltransferase YjiC (YdhE family)
VSRFLFVVQPLAGHIYPAAGVAHHLAARGHEVAWVGPERSLRPVVGPAAVIHPTGTRLYRPQDERGLAAMKSLWDGFILPLARFTLASVDKAVADCRPDVVVVDQHAVAGALAARRHGLPWATLATGSMELTRPYRGLPKVEAWFAARIAALCAQAGVPPGEDFSPLFSPHLVLAFTSAALAGGAARAWEPARDTPAPPAGEAPLAGEVALAGQTALAGEVALAGQAALAREAALAGQTALAGKFAPHAGAAVDGRLVLTGPVFGPRPPVPDFPWERLRPGTRRVLVTAGTLANDVVTGFYTRAMTALATLAPGVSGVITGSPDALPAPPPGVLVLPQVPVLDLMPHLDAVVCHGGMNTVCEALAHGVPLVVAPIRHDQPVTAAQVAAAGAGIRVRFGRAGAGQLAQAIRAVLGDPRYRAAATRIGESFTKAGGGNAAAACLERLATQAGNIST